jgi:hypothetical protein
VESWRIDAPTRPCAFCRQNVEDPCTFCPRCEAVYHPDCWVSNSRRCAVYGCEPGQKPVVLVTRPVRPILEPPELPRNGAGWTWLLPILLIVGINLARLGTGGHSSHRSPSPAEWSARGDSSRWKTEHPHSWTVPKAIKPEELDLHRMMKQPAPVQPAHPDDIPVLMEEARAIEASTPGIVVTPGGRMKPPAKADLEKLERALNIYRSCAATRQTEELRERIDKLQSAIHLRRFLMRDVKEPD